MSAVTRPRGPLPPKVYWVRRLFVAVLALVVATAVWGLVGLVRGIGGGDGGGSATPVAAERDPSPTPTPTSSASDVRRGGRADKGSTGTTQEKPQERLARPSGPCADSDVVVTPEVVEPYVGSPTVVLQLTTVEAEACTWEVSPDSVFLVISDDKGPLWSSQDCPAAIPTREVVPRREKPAQVVVGWNGRLSDRECSDATDWVYPGEYVATAVARGSVTPVEVAFVMTKQPPPEPTEEPSEEPTEEPSTTPSGTPSESASPDQGRRDR